MKRVMVLGCCGAGKSTLSKKLQEKTGLTLIHLDQYFWQKNWKETPKAEWKEIVSNLANKEEWIIDGNYGGTIPIRLERADTIIYLKYPTWKCLYRVCKRIYKYKGKVRPDMPEGCKERWDIDFLHYVLTFNLIRSKKHQALLDSVKHEKTVILLKSDNEVKDFLETLD